MNLQERIRKEKKKMTSIQKYDKCQESATTIESEVETQLSLTTRSAINLTLNQQRASENLAANKDRRFEVPANFYDFCHDDKGTTENDPRLIFGTEKRLRVFENKQCTLAV